MKLAAMLDAEGAFAGMGWHDAKHAATAIMLDALGPFEGLGATV